MEPMLNIALRAARKAGELIERAAERVDLVSIEEKGRNDFVTEVDKAAEKEIIYHLKKAYPDHSIIGEEGGSQPGANTDVEWIIDPLDGTTNFIHGIPQYSVSIACRIKGQLEHAVVYDPIKRLRPGKHLALFGRPARNCRTNLRHSPPGLGGVGFSLCSSRTF